MPFFSHASRLVRTALAVLLTVTAAGCYSGRPQFPLNELHVLRREREYGEKFTRNRRRELGAIMVSLFGTPDEPRLPAEGSAELAGVLDLSRLAAAAGPVASDESGRSRGLYREHCAVCHGIGGSGVGPTAAFLNPYPRDFRPGTFKFKSTPKGEKPTAEDLRRLLVRGIPGTAMPSYQALPPEEIDSLVDYVKYLAIRGEVEQRLIDFAADELQADEPIVDENASAEEQQQRRDEIGEFVRQVAETWSRAERAAIQIGQPVADRDRAVSIARGDGLFHGEVATCYKCHGPTGRGDGQTTDHDDWTKAIEPTNPEAVAAFCRAGAFAPRTIRPRNLRLGVYHGGGQPTDIFTRIHNGIDGTPMPAALVKPPESPSESKGLTVEEIWCLVDYVLSLPAESTPKEAR